MKRILKFLCILSISLIPVSAFGQGKVSKTVKRTAISAANSQKKTSSARTAPTKGKINGHDYVDLGLPSGLIWATCNVGAKSPSDYGSYFAWGEIQTKKDYGESNSLTFGSTLDDIGGDAEYDVARAIWGGRWRLPTKAEFEELINKCKWSFITMDGHGGYKITGPNGNYIFLPAAGYRYGSSLTCAGSDGYYWSSIPGDSNNSYDLSFDSDNRCMYDDFRYLGLSVRPVVKRIWDKSPLLITIRFSPKSDKIMPIDEINVYNIAEWLKFNPEEEIIIVGYTDPTDGTSSYNLSLCERRAKAVADQLVNKYGIDRSRLTLKFEGSDILPYSNNEWNNIVIINPK